MLSLRDGDLPQQRGEKHKAAARLWNAIFLALDDLPVDEVPLIIEPSEEAVEDFSPSIRQLGNILHRHEVRLDAFNETSEIVEKIPAFMLLDRTSKLGKWLAWSTPGQETVLVLGKELLNRGIVLPSYVPSQELDTWVICSERMPCLLIYIDAGFDLDASLQQTMGESASAAEKVDSTDRAVSSRFHQLGL
jgi:hypothetical protein